MTVEEAAERREVLEEQADLALIDLYDITEELDRRRLRLLRSLGPLVIFSGVAVLILLMRRKRSSERMATSNRALQLSRAAIWQAALGVGVLVALGKRHIPEENGAWSQSSPIRRLGSGRLS
jgi:hypothetical protein